jgi:predicted GNAT family acetyltransferase
MSAMQRIEIERDGKIAVLDYTFTDDALSIWHVVTPPELRGQGIGGQLVEKARALADEKKLRLVPVCPFAKHYLSTCSQTS